MSKIARSKPTPRRGDPRSNRLGIDPLSRLPNRESFNEHLQRAVKHAHKIPFALVVLGLDRFRDINHLFGPRSGDLVLRQCERRFAAASDGASFTASLGGDEFAAIVSLNNEVAIKELCARLVGALDAPFLLAEAAVELSASIGVALCPEHGVDADMIFQRANIALELTKRFGRGFSIYEAATDPYLELKRAYVGGLRHAIEQDHIALSYQPKFDLNSKRTIGVEALALWQHPELGRLPASQFVPVAERCGLIHALSRWILRSAMAQSADWQRVGVHIPVAVNLSPRNFHDRHLPEYIDQLLEDYGLAPDAVEIEITESAVLTDAAHVVRALETLSRKGVRIFIDDFGTGYSSLGHIKTLPLAGVKIDQSFVRQVTTDQNDAAIVRSIVDLGHRLGLQVIAEGVESQVICDRLAALGCDAVQGYFISPPREPHDLEHWLACPVPAES